MKVQTLLSNYLIVRPLAAKKTTKGGLHIPINAKAPYWYGEVLHTGAGYLTDRGTVQPMTVKVGDVVCVPKNQGEELPLEDDVVTIVRENFVLFVVDKASIPRDSGLKGIDGKPLTLSDTDRAVVDAIEAGTFQPQSRALPDSVYANREAYMKAIEGGLIAKDDPAYAEEWGPGEAPDPEDEIKRERNAPRTIITNK